MHVPLARVQLPLLTSSNTSATVVGVGRWPSSCLPDLPRPPAMNALFAFGSPIEVDVILDGVQGRGTTEVKVDKEKRESCPIFYDGEGIKGVVNIRLKDGRKFAHEGIKVEFVGSIGERAGERSDWSELQRDEAEILTIVFRPSPGPSYLARCARSPAADLFYDRNNHHEFLCLASDLAAPGEMRQAQSFPFEFKNVEKQYESHQGINVKLR